MTIPPQQPSFSPHHFPFPSQFPIKIHTMYNPTQFSHNNDHNFHTNLSNNRTSTKFPNDQETLQFRPINQNQEPLENDDSGVCSPPLWKSSAVTQSPSTSPSQPLLSHQIQKSLLSPNSRAQAIARGQMELMEMVKNMPESSYELSLKDLVEHHRMENNQTHQENLNKNQVLQQRGAVKRQESKKSERNLMRNGSLEHKGLFLNLGFRFSLNKKKKFGNNGSSSGRVSPKPEVLKGGGERDWWKKKFTGSSDSDSSRTSGAGSTTTVSSGGGGSSSGRSYVGGREKQGFLTGCWPFLHSRKSKIED